MLTLGQSGSMSSMLVWIVVLIVVAIVGGVLIFSIRRRMLAGDDSVSVGSSGLLDHLHQMHRSGEMDDEEYARARNAILRKVRDDVEPSKRGESKGKDLSFLDGADLDGIDLDNS